MSSGAAVIRVSALRVNTGFAIHYPGVSIEISEINIDFGEKLCFLYKQNISTLQRWQLMLTIEVPITISIVLYMFLQLCLKFKVLR